MKKISKIMGIVVTFALLVSMMVAAVPASAAPLAWTPETLPGTTDYRLAADGTNIQEIAANGDTIYVATGTNTNGLMKSTDCGISWSSLSSAFHPTCTGNIMQVAVSPDDPDVLVISTSNNKVFYSETGGARWSALDQPGSALTVVDIDVSPGPLRYVAAVGNNGSGAAMYKMFLSMAQSWTEEYTPGTGEAASQTNILAVKFSPNYQTDKIISVVTINSTYATFQVFWDESDNWNDQITGFDSNYPVQLPDSAAYTVASIALPATYLGTDYTERIAFVGLGNAGSDGGVYRLSDYSIGNAGKFATWSSGLEGPIGSIAYHESGKLVAGSYTSNKVYSCLSPLATAPKFQRENVLKRPGGTNKTYVAWAGDTVVATTQGDESALALSTDDGLTFGDYALIDTDFNAVNDVAVTADGSKTYMATRNGTAASLWLKASEWKRVLNLTLQSASNGLIVRVAPDDSDAIYVAENGSTGVWVSKNGGLESWKEVPCYKVSNLKDLEVYDADTAYVLDTAGVSKTSNAGASWGTKKTLDGVSTGYDLALTPNGDLIVGGAAAIAYSTDAGASFTKITKAVGSGAVTVLADPDYENNNTIYGATTSGSALKVYRMAADKGTTPSSSRSIDMIAQDSMTNNAVTGMVADGTVLYVLTTNGTDSRLYRALNYRTAATTTLALWSSVKSSGTTLGSTTAPNGIKMSSGPKLWAISGAGIRSIIDPIAQTPPTLNTPTDGQSIAVNPQTGKAYNVTFSLDRYNSTSISEVTIQIATDADFQGVVFESIYDITAISGNTVSKIIGPTGSSGAGTAADPNYLVDFNPGETYYWRARSNNTSGGALISAWSAGQSFTIDQADTFKVSGPTVGAADVALTPTFTWAKYEGAIGYEVVLSEDPSFGIIDWSRNADDTYYKVPAEDALKYSTTYYWRVRGVTGDSYLVGRAWVTPAGPWVTGVFTTMAEPVEEETEGPIVITEPGETEVKIVEVPITTPQTIPTYLLWVIVAVGAILVIALIVLIVRTRRVA
jgi:hypothetical protein